MAKRKGNPPRRKTGGRGHRAACRVSAEGQTEGAVDRRGAQAARAAMLEGGGHEPAHPARCQGRHPQCRDRARPHRQPHPRAQSGRRPPAGQATDRGVWGERNLSAPPRSPAPWESGQGAAGRPPLGPGCATAPRTPAGDERVAGEDRRQRDSRTREGRAAPGRYPIGGRRPRERDGAPLEGRAATASSMRPRRIRELSLSRPVRARIRISL